MDVFLTEPLPPDSPLWGMENVIITPHIGGMSDIYADQALPILQRTPKLLSHWLNGLDSPWIQNNYGENTFSPFDVVGHLLHGEQTDWMARVELILEQGTSQPFTPWDRYAMYEESQGKTISQLLDEFAAARQENLVAVLHTIRQLARNKILLRVEAIQVDKLATPKKLHHP